MREAILIQTLKGMHQRISDLEDLVRTQTTALAWLESRVRAEEKVRKEHRFHAIFRTEKFKKLVLAEHKDFMLDTLDPKPAGKDKIEVKEASNGTR